MIYEIGDLFIRNKDSDIDFPSEGIMIIADAVSPNDNRHRELIDRDKIVGKYTHPDIIELLNENLYQCLFFSKEKRYWLPEFMLVQCFSIISGKG